MHQLWDFAFTPLKELMKSHKNSCTHEKNCRNSTILASMNTNPLIQYGHSSKHLLKSSTNLFELLNKLRDGDPLGDLVLREGGAGEGEGSGCWTGAPGSECQYGGGCCFMPRHLKEGDDR